MTCHTRASVQDLDNCSETAQLLCQVWRN